MTKLTRRDWRNADTLLGGDGTVTAMLGIKAPIVRQFKERLHPPEWQEQQAVVSWWDKQCTAWGYDYRHLVAVPNGAHLAGDAQRREIQMVRLKRQGLRVGYPDLQLLIPMNENGGLLIEMKAMDGHTSQVQDDYHALLRRHYRVAVCKGAAAAIAVISEYLGRG